MIEERSRSEKAKGEEEWNEWYREKDGMIHKKKMEKRGEDADAMKAVDCTISERRKSRFIYRTEAKFWNDAHKTLSSI